MPTLVSFSESDLLRNKLLDPGWYRLRIESVSEWSPTKDQKSNNCTVETLVQSNEKGETEGIAGVPITLLFNDQPKARGFIEGFFRALGVNIEPGSRYDMQAAAGKEIDAFVERNEFEGRISNRVNHKYRMVRG